MLHEWCLKLNLFQVSIAEVQIMHVYVLLVLRCNLLWYFSQFISFETYNCHVNVIQAGVL
jgi:hypothetical protein